MHIVAAGVFNLPVRIIFTLFEHNAKASETPRVCGQTKFTGRYRTTAVTSRLPRMAAAHSCYVTVCRFAGMILRLEEEEADLPVRDIRRRLINTCVKGTSAQQLKHF